MKKEIDLKKAILLVILSIAILICIGVLVKNYIPKETIKVNETLDSNKSINVAENQLNIHEEFKNPEKLMFITKSGESEKEQTEEIKLEKLKLSNFVISNSNESVLITGEIENITDEPIENIELIYTLYMKDDTEPYTYTMKISEKIEAKEKRNVETCIGYKYEDIAGLDVKMEKIEEKE